jgi:threonine-phosphate decarboxylase
MISHGGDVWQVAEQTGVRAAALLDFSANINPRGLPPRALERLARDASDSQSLRFYPDPSANHLRNVLSEQHSAPAEAMVVGPGAEALIAPILKSFRARRVLIPMPAFSEYTRVCEQQESEYVPFFLDRSECFRIPVDRLCECIQGAQCDCVILNNPHNPSGALLHPDGVRRIVETARSCEMSVVLDEAFIDYAPGASLLHDALAQPGMMVIRSLTKFYGCPALRIGYAVGQPDSVQRVASLMPAWPVTQLAIDALAEAVQDRDYAQASIDENAIRREDLAQTLSGLGGKVIPSAANFLLVELADAMPPAAELRARLIHKHRILIRNCDSYGGLAPGRYIRVAVRSAEDNGRLVRALREEAA